MADRKKVAVLYLCSGTYIAFWKSFYINFKRYFLVHSDVHYFLFTDAKEIYSADNPDVHVHQIDAKGWPGASLMRYHHFCDIEDEIREYDYCYFMNACMHCTQIISERELFVDKGHIVVVEHPLHAQNRMLFGNDEANRLAVYERDPKFMAYIPVGGEKTYVIGAINGGDSDAFMDMSRTIKAEIDEDLQSGHMPPGFDEAYLNHYIYENNNYVLLGSEYCHPQVFRLPVEQKIMILEKIDLVDVYSIKNGDNFELNMTKRKLVAEQEKKTVLQKLLFIGNVGEQFERVLLRRHYSSVAIYGYRDMGDLLCQLLEETSIAIKYIIDNKIVHIQREIQVKQEESIRDINDVDCIIIAHPSLYYGVIDRCGDTSDIPIISIDEIAHECYMEYLKKNEKQ